MIFRRKKKETSFAFFRRCGWNIDKYRSPFRKRKWLCWPAWDAFYKCNAGSTTLVRGGLAPYMIIESSETARCIQCGKLKVLCDFHYFSFYLSFFIHFMIWKAKRFISKSTKYTLLNVKFNSAIFIMYRMASVWRSHSFRRQRVRQPPLASYTKYPSKFATGR